MALRNINNALPKILIYFFNLNHFLFQFDEFLAKRKTPLDTVVEFTEPTKWMFTGILNGKNQVGKYYSKKDSYASVDSSKPFSQVSAKVDEVFGKYVKVSIITFVLPFTIINNK